VLDGLSTFVDMLDRSELGGALGLPAVGMDAVLDLSNMAKVAVTP
jgi:hypothetical protein